VDFRGSISAILKVTSADRFRLRFEEQAALGVNPAGGIEFEVCCFEGEVVVFVTVVRGEYVDC
jgi:hypothetical protein